jgi:hypothetical protein
MIQVDPVIIPESLKVAGWIGGAGFTVWLFKMSAEIFKGIRNNGKDKTIFESPDWINHSRDSGDMKNCITEIVKTQQQQALILQRMADNDTVKIELLKKIEGRGQH